MATSLNPLEAIFLDWEDSSESNHMHVNWAVVFEPLPDGGAPSLADLRKRVSERLDFFPRFRDRLSRPHVGRLSRPKWIPDPTFDIARHVNQATLPAPGVEEQLFAWLANLATTRLDRRHPVWHLTLLTGLADGRWAAAFQVHHCMLDGTGGAIATVGLLIDREVQVGRATTVKDAPGRSPGTRPRTLRLALSGARNLAKMVRGSPDPGAKTSLMVPLSPHRHLAFVDVPLSDLRVISKTLGGTVNDVVLTAAVSGLRAMFVHREELPLPSYLRVMVPVNMRSRSEQSSIAVNVSYFSVNVPLSEDDILKRYEGAAHSTHMNKQSRQALRDQTLVDLATLLPPMLERTLRRFAAVLGHFDLVITNVPGPPGELTCFGAKLDRVLPALPPTVGHALNFVICSYAGRLTFGINADRDAVPDLDVVQAGTQHAVEELGTLAAQRSG